MTGYLRCIGFHSDLCLKPYMANLFCFLLCSFYRGYHELKIAKSAVTLRIFSLCGKSPSCARHSQYQSHVAPSEEEVCKSNGAPSSRIQVDPKALQEPT